MIGHQEIVNDLKALRESGALGHGYIFFGPSMTGKRISAMAFARFLEKGEFEVPGENEVLQDVLVIDRAFMRRLDPDKKDSIGIDAVREIKNFLWQKPIASPRRTLILDEIELMTTEAQNALLKIAEEPPASSLVIVIASDIEGLLPTIVSRLPKIYFGPVPEVEIVRWLEEGGIPKAKAAACAKRAFGKPGLAWRLLHDEQFRKDLELAEKFLKSAKTTRRDLIKKIIEPDDFNLRKFLEAVIINLAEEKPSRAKAALWHKTLTLYGNVNNFGLNPRIQLENLLA